MRRIRDDLLQTQTYSPRGVYQFGVSQTNCAGNCALANGTTSSATTPNSTTSWANDLASFLLDSPQASSTGRDFSGTFPTYRAWYFFPYVADRWQVSNRVPLRHHAQHSDGDDDSSNCGSRGRRGDSGGSQDGGSRHGAGPGVSPTRRREVPRPELRCPRCRAELERFWSYCPDCAKQLAWRDAQQTGAECDYCRWMVSDSFSFCPWCGRNIADRDSSPEPLKAPKGFKYDAAATGAAAAA